MRAPDLSVAGRNGGPWIVTVLATAVSTYALDAAATAAGVLLAASGLLASLGRAPLLVFLGATYVVWGAGLRVNLAANWALLARTGTSTNVLSKAAHDIARARTSSERVRRVAASVGYVATELAKEAPYYAGASGAVLVSDALSANDAIVFLGGANLGAAAYEYGLARATRTFLGSRARRDGYASFDADWVPAEYLADYRSSRTFSSGAVCACAACGAAAVSPRAAPTARATPMMRDVDMPRDADAVAPAPCCPGVRKR